ncbi:hypothetical protein [Streptomyces sp. S186]|uniref:hypothetical protein n=1 Tax=Streptomyces sp. S186 TaxID=3434395 RepID=UPI003F664498
MSTPWSQVQRIERVERMERIERGDPEETFVITLDGKRHRLGPTTSNMPNPFVFRAIVERLRAEGGG